MGRPIRLHFILSPRLRGVAKESATDELLMAVGAWTTELHEEVYVFDSGYWCKNEELWKSVKGASWDEVCTLYPNTLKRNPTWLTRLGYS